MSERVLAHVNIKEKHKDGKKDKLPLLYVNDPEHTRSIGSVFHLYLYHLDGGARGPSLCSDSLLRLSYRELCSLQPISVITSLIRRGTYQRAVRVFASHCDLTCRLCMMR